MLFEEDTKTSGASKYEEDIPLPKILTFEEWGEGSQILKFHSLLESEKLPQSILLPDFYTISDSLVLSFISGILKKPLSGFENIDAFHLKPNEHGNVLMEDVKSALSFASKTGIFSNYKFILIYNVSELSISAANALLKVIEEPAKDTFFLMFYSNKKAILPTIRSRCVFLDFPKTDSNFNFVAKCGNIKPENLELIKDLTGGDLNKIKYFVAENIQEILLDFENLIKNNSFISFKKFLTKYQQIKNFQIIVFFLVEGLFLAKITQSQFNQALIKKYFSFISRKKYVKLYNTNFDLTLYCTINNICAEVF